MICAVKGSQVSEERLRMLMKTGVQWTKSVEDSTESNHREKKRENLGFQNISRIEKE